MKMAKNIRPFGIVTLHKQGAYFAQQ